MNDNLMTLNKVQTRILTWGKPFNCKGADVIICISGNPGIPDFYSIFGSHLHLNTKLSVCVIGQAGHEEVPDRQSNELRDQEHLFNLEGQIQHKLDLITNHIDNESKLHLVGHSIGAWLILELLKKNEMMIERLSSVNLLFPTVQRMAESKSGLFFNNVIRKIHALLMILTMLLYLIPVSILRSLVKLYLKFTCLPEHWHESILKFCRPKVIEKVLFLAYDEMDSVKALNCDIISKIKNKTNVLYGPRDGWVPVQYMEDWRRFEPDLKIEEVDVEHAFVLKSSERIAELVSDFIKTKVVEDNVPTYTYS